MIIRKMLNSYVKLDHTLYSINYGTQPKVSVRFTEAV